MNSGKAIPASVVAAIGVGYVGFSLAVEFGKKSRAIGFDLSQANIHAYTRRVDPNGEVPNHDYIAAIRPARLDPTTDAFNSTYDPISIRKTEFCVCRL